LDRFIMVLHVEVERGWLEHLSCRADKQMATTFCDFWSLCIFANMQAWQAYTKSIAW
jgi:hypothetical protein